MATLRTTETPTRRRSRPIDATPTRVDSTTVSNLSRHEFLMGTLENVQRKNRITTGRFRLPIKTTASMANVTVPVLARMSMKFPRFVEEEYDIAPRVARPTIANRSRIRSTAILERLGKKPTLAL